MDDEKKKIIIGNCFLAGIALTFFGLGWVCGKSNSTLITRIICFPVPEKFTPDAIQYCMDEVMDKLKSNNFKVSNDELRNIVGLAIEKTISSTEMTDGLFNVTGD